MLCGVEELTVKAAPTDVAVVERIRLKRWLLSRREVLTPERTVRITEATRQLGMWR